MNEAFLCLRRRRQAEKISGPINLQQHFYIFFFVTTLGFLGFSLNMLQAILFFLPRRSEAQKVYFKSFIEVLNEMYFIANLLPNTFSA